MRDQVWWLLIGITLLAVVFYRLLALWDRHRVRRKLLRTLMSREGGSFIRLSSATRETTQTDFLHGTARPGGPKSCE
jgi:hypothetical protein